MANYEVLEPGGHAALVDGLKDYADREGGTDTEQLADGSVEMDKLGDDVLDELDSKAYADGYYAQLTAGAADNLTGRGDATTAEFLYRTAGGTADIETGQAVAKSVKGNTLVWNQLISEADIHKSGTEASNAWLYTLNFAMTSGHKYLLIRSGAYADYGNTCRVVSTTGTTIVYSGTPNIPNKQGVIFDCTETRDTYFVQAWVVSGEDYDFYLNLFDLTAMFGAGNEPSTVAEFEALYPLSYYPYDAGSLLSVNMKGIETVGFNQWDEEWELGGYSSANGSPIAYTNRIRSKNPIPVFPSTEYCVRCSTSVNFIVNAYDADGAFIDNVVGSVVGQDGKTFTTPANARYIKFSPSNTYGTTYNHDICINLSWSGRRNGEYEPFWSSQREIAASTYFPDGMRSAGTVRDELTSTEAITRVGVVDLGTLTWTYSNAFFRTSDLNSVILRPASNYTAADAKCSKYEIASWNSETDKSVMVGRDAGNLLLVKDTDYTDAATFKTAMSGVMLYYALATPTVTPIDPALNLSYRVDDFGTERIMVPEDERSAPPVLDIAYGLNVVDFVRRAPTEYISHASMSQFRLALMSHLGVFINETWDEVDNRYKYTITSE